MGNPIFSVEDFQRKDAEKKIMNHLKEIFSTTEDTEVTERDKMESSSFFLCDLCVLCGEFI